jgi:hypothetical protein
MKMLNARFRTEFPNSHWFQNLDDARSKMEDWRRYYDEERSHRAIGQIPPIALDLPLKISTPVLARRRTMKRQWFSEEQVIGVLHEHEAGARAACTERAITLRASPPTVQAATI